MTREELIDHLEHLAEYVKYSEDAPALREAIALLKTHEKRTETHACDLIQPDHSADVSKMVNGDVVSRREETQTILEFIVEYLGGAFDENLQKKLIERINALSFAQPEQRWIPCSERLPKEDVEVLVTDDAGGITTIDVDRCGMYEDTKERFWYTSQHVIAWIPLPEPYRGEEK